MKKLILATACSLATGNLYAENTTEQRIQQLETQLQQLKQELQQQKNTQSQFQENQVVLQQASADADTQANQTKKIVESMVDNVDIYGFVRLDGAIDFKSTPSARGRTINQINKAPFNEPDSVRSDFTLAASRIGLNIKDLGGNPNIKAKIETDFWTNSGKGDGGVRIRHAYLNAYNWTVGQAWSLMSNPEISTDAVDYSLLLGSSVLRTPQVSYAWKINPDQTLNLGLEYMASGDRSSGLPALSSKYSFKNGPWHTLAQGFINEKQAQTESKDIEKLGWGVGLGGRYKFEGGHSVQAQYYHIVGDQRIVSYLTQGSTSDGVAWGGDYSVDPIENELLLNRFDSAVLGYSHLFNPQWRANLSASFVNFDDDSDYAKANPESNKRLTDYVINAIYTPLKNIDLGAEYHHGQRESFDGKQADVSRVNLSAKYSF